MTIIINDLGLLITSRNEKIFVFIIIFCTLIVIYGYRRGGVLHAKPTKCLKLSTIDEGKLGYEMSSK